MSENNMELAFQWLKKADHDLVTAKQTLKISDGPTDTVCFHAQQAAEKALKALLTFHETRFPRIHELGRLLEFAARFLPDLEDFRESFAEMSGFAIEVRYPGDLSEPPRDDAEKSLNIAEKVVELVGNHMKKRE